MLSDAARPLSPAEFAAALEGLARFEGRPLIAVATSGGADSLALALLAERWARERGGRMWALTVDHGLRTESSAEIGQLEGWLRARGVFHQVLVWLGPKPSTRIEERARAARYRLLAEWCRAHACLHLLTAHHCEDQRETHLIRARAKSGPDGLAAMSAVREIDGCRVLRPLLATPKARLVATLEVEGQSFLSDPSNENPAFERARLRCRPPCADPRALDAEIANFAEARRARARNRDRLSSRAVAIHPAGFAVVDRGAVLAARREEGERLLAALAATIGGGEYPPRRERVARLLRMLAAEPERGRTLGGCRFLPWRRHILVIRELARGAPALRLRPGVEILWDRRFAVRVPAGAAEGLAIGYLGEAGPARRSLRAAGPALPALLHAALPAFSDADGLVAVPALRYRREGAGILPRLAFRPAWPLTSAGFTVV